jgi:uncharacterized protein YgiM (DUF1202 family)
MKAKVIKSHNSDVLIPFKASKGEIVQGEERPTQWEGWLYCTNNKGLNGWVPSSYLESLGDQTNKYQLNRSYNAFEISASVGDLVEIVESESGWALIANEDGKKGWIPLDNLDYGQ